MPIVQGTLVADTLAKILASVIMSPPEAALGKVDCLSQSNVDQVCEWNNSCSTQAVERCIHNVIADRAFERPYAEAVCAWDGLFTYYELHTVAGRLAARLVQFGVGPEVLVPLCFDKSVSGFLEGCFSSALSFCVRVRHGVVVPVTG